MNDPEASLAVKAWWASRDALGGGGGREPDVRHLPHPFLSWGALACTMQWQLGILGLLLVWVHFSSAERLDGL